MLHDTHDWAVILADGPASCEESLQRAAAVAPRERTCVLLTASPRRRGRAGWSAIDPRNTIVQPRRRGTALDVLLPLLHLERRDPRARVAILPSARYAVAPERLGRSLRLAMSQVASSVDEIVRVEAATRRAGASVLLVARVDSLLGLYERRFPHVVHALDWAVERGALDGGHAVAELYEQLPNIDLARHLLHDQDRHLRPPRVADRAVVVRRAAPALYAAL